MKKILFILFLVVCFFSGGIFFMMAKNLKVLPSQADVGNSADMRAMASFQGVLDFDFERPVVQTNAGENPPPDIPREAAGPIRNIFASQENETGFSFAVLGDTQYFDAGNPNGNFQKAARSISKLDPGLVVSVGDLISSCEGKSKDTRDYADWKNILGTLASKTYAVQGNHDRVSDGESCDRIWQSAFSFPTNGPSGFSELAYSLDFQNSHFVFLSTIKPDGHEINSTQRNWLDEDLAKNTKENTFVVFHEPAYPVSDKATESLDVDPSQRNAFWNILEKHAVTAVFNGHEHIVSRKKAGNIYQFVFGNTDSFNHGLPAKGIAEYSNQGQGRFGFVKVKGKEITVETHGPDGALLNTFTFSK